MPNSYGLENVVQTDIPILVETVTDWNMFLVALIAGGISAAATIIAVLLTYKVTTRQHKETMTATKKRYNTDLERYKADKIREEKLTIFKQLMATRNIRDYDRIKAINSIDIIFNDCAEVTEACVVYITAMKEYEKAEIKAYEEAKREYDEAMEKATTDEAKRGIEYKSIDVDEKAVKDGEINLLKTIAEHLGFTNININAIVHNSFQPGWLNERRNFDYLLMGKLNKMMEVTGVQGVNLGGVNFNKLPTLCTNCQKRLENMKNALCKGCKAKLGVLTK